LPLFFKGKELEFINKIKHYKTIQLKLCYNILINKLCYNNIFFQEENPFFQGEKLPIAAKKGIHVID